MADHPGKISFKTARAIGDRRLAVDVFAGEGTPNVTSGYGGWEVIERPGRESVVNWTGFEPLRVTVPILFDALDSERDHPGQWLEDQIAKLEGMAGRGRFRQSSQEPPVVHVDAPGSLVPHQMSTGDDPSPIEYVIEDIGWGDAVRNRSGNRIRQAAEVTLLRHVTARGLERSAAKRKGHGKQKLPRRYTIKKGDTYRQLAKRFYDDPGKWEKIYDANKKQFRDPRNLPVGKTIRIPALRDKK